MEGKKGERRKGGREGEIKGWRKEKEEGERKRGRMGGIKGGSIE